jgi:hypothetical protein
MLPRLRRESSYFTISKELKACCRRCWTFVRVLLGKFLGGFSVVSCSGLQFELTELVVGIWTHVQETTQLPHD